MVWKKKHFLPSSWHRFLGFASPHDADQTVLFSQKRWGTLPFSAAAIAADPALTTLKLSEQGVTGFGKSFVSAAQHAWSVC